VDELTRPADIDLTAAPGHLIRRAQQQHQNSWSELVGSGLTSVQFAVLALLTQRPGVDQRTLAASLSIDTSTLADVCLRLANRGLLARERSPEDGRRYILSVTPEGQALLRRTAPAVDAVGDALLAPLDADERATLMRLLRRVIGIEDVRDRAPVR
jgi:MarR family transcriptional regulator, temperature-dependent positive regulator of motility